jgi:hypothetical protein
MKLLHCKIDTLTKKSKFFVEHNPWINNYLTLKIPDSENYKAFAYLNDGDLVKHKAEMSRKIDLLD